MLIRKGNSLCGILFETILSRKENRTLSAEDGISDDVRMRRLADFFVSLSSRS
jgi:hypothetical protein